jgi:hypothetical protein
MKKSAFVIMMKKKFCLKTNLPISPDIFLTSKYKVFAKTAT